MPQLNQIVDEVCGLLREITVANGYDLDFGTVNVAGVAARQYPYAEVTYADEQASTDDAMAAYGFANAEVTIKLYIKLSTLEDAPTWAADRELDKVACAVKRRLGVHAGYLSLTSGSVITYSRFSRPKSKNGDAFVPGELITLWKVQYQFTEQ